MLSFSTCWNNARHTCGEEMIDEILELGFDTLELSHGMTVTKLPGIQSAFKKGKFRCIGVHNYFPSPTEVMIDAPDAYEFSSDNPNERRRAFELTLKTIEMAQAFGAYYVVLHMGSVAPMPHKKWTGELTKKLANGEQLSGPYADDKLCSRSNPVQNTKTFLMSARCSTSRSTSQILPTLATGMISATSA